MEHDLNDESVGPVVTLLRRTFEAKAGEIEVGPPDHQPIADARPRRYMAVAAAVALVVVGATSLVGSRALAPDDGERSVGGAPTTAASTAPAGPAAIEAVQWYLPTRIPTGFALADLSAGAVEPNAALEQQRWVIKADDGLTTEGWMTVSAFAVDAGRGSPGQLRSDPQVSSWGTPDFGGWTVDWIEDGTQVQIQATEQLDTETLLAIAGSSIVADGDVIIDPTSVPAELVAVDTGAAAASIAPAPAVSFTLDRTSGDGGGVWVTIAPEARTLDAIVNEETERRDLDGVQYSILEGETDENGPYTTVRWLADGIGHELIGRVTAGEAIEIAASIEPATSEQAAAAANGITGHLHSLPVVASAVLSNGMTLSAHGPADGGNGGAIALCVDQPRLQCVQPGTESTLGGGAEAALYDVVSLDGRWVVGWQFVEPTNIVPIDGLEVERATTGEGWFVTVPVGAGGEVPTITFDLGADAQQSYNPTDRLRPG
jgi:hypothetical protein